MYPQEPGGSQLAAPDGSLEMPEIINITFHVDEAYSYQKIQIGLETIYVCEKGSKRAREGELLVLRWEPEGDRGIWTAFDSAIRADRLTLQCRQRVFRCPENITQPGWHDWERNGAASRGVMPENPEWQGTLSAETRVP